MKQDDGAQWEQLQQVKIYTGNAHIDIAPLVDIGFILLIFFMVATVFPDNKAVVIEKPRSSYSADLAQDTIVVSIDAQNRLILKGVEVSVDDAQALLTSEINSRPEAAVLVRADRRATTEALITVIDLCKSSGAQRVGIATDEKTI